MIFYFLTLIIYYDQIEKVSEGIIQKYILNFPRKYPFFNLAPNWKILFLQRLDSKIILKSTPILEIFIFYIKPV